MMKFSKFIVVPVLIASLAALLQVVDQLLGSTAWLSDWKGFGWVSFQAWALYFLAGCSIKGGILTLLSYTTGIIGSIAIMALGGTLAESGFGFWAVPLALLVVVIPVICLERIPWLSFIPGLFVGAGAYFAFMSYVPGATFGKAMGVELTYCVVGLVFGWITVTLRTRYEAYVAQKTK